MTENEATEKLRAYHKCQKMQVKGIYEDCNARLCDNCDLCYAQGNTGEHIKSIEIAIQALEKRIPKKPRKTDSYRGVLKKSICLCMPYLWKCTFRKIHERTAEYSVLLGLRSKIRLER